MKKKEMKFPKRIKIGDYYYSIKKMKIVDWNNFKVDGQVNYFRKTIKVKANEKHKKMEEETLFHEIAHGLMKELEYNYPKLVKFRNDEDFTQEFGLMLRKIFVELLEAQE